VPADAEPRRDLPEGTVSLLFADVEGSTRLLYALGQRFAPARARLRQIVREAAGEHAGHEVDWAGDGVFLAFAGAREAIGAAATIQRRLAAEPASEGHALRLRIGIHTGEPQLLDEGYVGTDVVIAARICSAAHGEQVVVSRATREVAGDDPGSGVAYRPLGRHRLKDVPTAEHLYQLVVPGVREEFPPLRTLGAASLPALHHRLVGRAAALERIDALLRAPEVRLVTITGPGGAGKSRLALEVAAGAAAERPVHLVGLAPVTHPDLVPDAIARALGVRESPGKPLAQCIAEELDGKGALLFLDNLEHLAPAAVHVAELLDRVADVDVLTTSRAPLRLAGEHVLPLGPLSVEDAATLFVELAAARGVVLQPDTLASVHEICRRLDGLPLAIELVAARLAVLPPAQILAALDEGLALEMEGPIDLPERQRTLRAAIDWSYRHLTESQQELHGALAVFANGCALDDAGAVSAAGSRFIPDLEALVAWSLVRSDVTDGDLRLTMLETVREHALERLRREGSLDRLRDRHAERFLELALGAESELTGPEQAAWLARLERELDNVRVALDWLLASGRVEDALRTISALERFWLAHGHVGEARRLLGFALALEVDASTDVRADALWTSARQAAAQSDWDAAAPLFEDALSLYRAQGRRREVVFALSELGAVAVHQKDVERAAELCEEGLSIARDLGDARATSRVLALLADVARAQGEHHRALDASAEALELRRTLGDQQLVTDSTYHLGVAAFGAGDLERAERALDDALVLARELGDARYTAAALCMLGSIFLLRDEVAPASERLQESLAIYTELEDERSQAECLCALGGCAAALGRPEEACLLWGAADALRGESPLEYAEPVIEARFGPELAASLGLDRLEQLRAEGRRLGHERVLEHARMVGAPQRTK